jgi:hypothetical protein
MILASRSPSRFRGRYAIDRRLARDPRSGGFQLADVARGSGKGCRYHLFIHRRGTGLR